MRQTGAAAQFVSVTLMVAASMCGCVMPPVNPRTVLEEHSDTSLTVGDNPLVLASEPRDVAVRARDYLTLVAAELNETGHRRLVWIGYQWSTIDARARDIQPTQGAPLLLVADGRDIRLTPIDTSAAALYLQNPALLAPDDTDAITTVYAIDDATLEYVATSQELSAAFPESRLTLPFTLCTDGRAALLRFVTEIRR